MNFQNQGTQDKHRRPGFNDTPARLPYLPCRHVFLRIGWNICRYLLGVSPVNRLKRRRKNDVSE